MSSEESSDESLEEISEERLEEPLESSLKKKRKIEDPIEDELGESSKPRYAKRKDKDTIEDAFDKTAHKISQNTLTKKELRDIASEHHTKVRVNAIELFQKCDLYDISIEEKYEMWLFAIQSAGVGRRKTIMDRDVQLIIDIWLKCKKFH